ncbi:MAG: NADH-quinone oxidoreductase subunit NuoE [Candidatus Bathyarchaeota archaeon]|nr:NADH-quinone oxidoreductase subunit NuoE [Candidatus Bathyarchaeota archaeon]
MQALALDFDEVVSSFKAERGELIPILQEIHRRLGYLSEKAIIETARYLGISETEVFGVASFYSMFRFTPPGEHTLKICLGTACHVQGGKRILETVERELDVKTGETTKDGNYSLEAIACFGCCSLAPVMVVDDKVYGRMTPDKAKKILGIR